MSLARRYRWELAPLLIGASVVWLRPLLPDETTGVLALWHLGGAALLGVGVVRVSRLGRPLPWPLSPFAAYALAAGVLLGLTWLFTTRWVVRRRPVHTGA